MCVYICKQVHVRRSENSCRNQFFPFILTFEVGSCFFCSVGPRLAGPKAERNKYDEAKFTFCIKPRDLRMLGKHCGHAGQTLWAVLH